jgi:DNA-binding MarR family transcriptional regulator
MNKAKPGTGNLHGDNPLRELIRIFGLVERVMLPYFAQFGISGSQWGVLVNLKRAERAGSRGLRLRELSERLLIRPPSVTGLIDRLERSSLVRRVPSQDDLRVRRIQLTADGRHLVARILSGHDSQVSKVMAGLNAEEQLELRRLLANWGHHLQKLLDNENSEPVAVGSGLVLSRGC